MKVDKRKLGKQIKMVRTSKRMTQEELAEMIDVSPTFISLVETGTNGVLHFASMGLRNTVFLLLRQDLCRNRS